MRSTGHDLVLDDEFDALSIVLPSEDRDASLLAKKYPARAHARKVANELRRYGGDEIGPSKSVIFLPGEPTRSFEDSDQGPDFRQRRYFYYLTGCDIADSAVTYEIGCDRLILWIPFVEPRQALWFGSVPNASKAAGLFDVDDVRYRKDLPRFLKANVDRSSTLFVLHEQQTPRSLELVTAKPTIDYVSLQPAMNRARVIKDDYEIALIRKANAISSAAHRAIARDMLKLRNEQDIEAIFRAGCTARGAHSQAYPIIAGAGVNASTLHYGANDQPLKGKELVVVDAGCEYKCYASDVTRTLPISGSFTREGREIYSIVEQMQEACIEDIKPGTLFAELHMLAARIAASGLLELGVLKGSLDAINENHVVSAFFPHGLGHHVGLEVHDVSGDYRLLHAKGQRPEAGKRELITQFEMSELEREISTRFDFSNFGIGKDQQTLEPGMIVTVEPGIYFNREYIQGYFLSRDEYAGFFDEEVLERYYSVGGVRIEDDILVTKGGYENLTTAPKGEDMLGAINGS